MLDTPPLLRTLLSLNPLTERFTLFVRVCQYVQCSVLVCASILKINATKQLQKSRFLAKTVLIFEMVQNNLCVSMNIFLNLNKIGPVNVLLALR